MAILIGINDEIIEATPDMIAKIEADQKAYKENEDRLEAERVKKAADKAALLDRLGITEDEAKLLLS